MDDTLSLQPRPLLHGWLAARGLGVADLAVRWKITPQGASRYLLAFENPRRIVPSQEKMADVLDWTKGEIGAAGWYPQELNPTPMAASVGELPVREDAQ